MAYQVTLTFNNIDQFNQFDTVAKSFLTDAITAGQIDLTPDRSDVVYSKITPHVDSGTGHASFKLRFGQAPDGQDYLAKVIALDPAVAPIDIGVIAV